MKTLAIISEFNPFHNGHKYLLNKSKYLTKSDVSISFMSGDFVQRGEPAILEKYERADISLNEGFDIVFEMPCFISLQSAYFFAYNSIKILNKLNVNYLAFGIENLSEKEFLEIANYIIINDSKINKSISEFIKLGYSYSKSSMMAINKISGRDDFITSNNILALEYMRSIRKTKSNIIPIPIKRKSTNNKDNFLREDGFASSTAIRNNLNDSNLESYLPKYSFSKIKKSIENNSIITFEDFFDIFYYKIYTENKKMNDVFGYEDGMYNLFFKNLKNYSSFEDFFKDNLSTRYTKSRMKRLIINYLLGNKTYLNSIDINFVNLLSFNKTSTKYILKIKDNINIINSKKDYDRLDKINKIAYNRILKSSNLYHQFDNKIINKDFIIKRQIKDYH